MSILIAGKKSQGAMGRFKALYPTLVAPLLVAVLGGLVIVCLATYRKYSMAASDTAIQSATTRAQNAGCVSALMYLEAARTAKSHITPGDLDAADEATDHCLATRGY